MDFKHKGRLPWLSHFIYSLRHRGLMNTCSMGLKEWQKERELGIDTFGAKGPDELSIDADSRPEGHLYQPSSSVIFKKAMNVLPIHFNEKVFLDIGSGKGRALILAAEFGFRKVIGVEYAAELNDVAYTNIERVRERFPNTEFILNEGDALTFDIPEEVDVIYLFNPFDEEATRKLLMKVKPTFKQSKQMYLVYVNPVHCNVLQQELGEPTAIVKNAKGIPEVKVFSNRKGPHL
ncbi:MAG: methyltransferase domain-containing protein [Flavobacteriales bacterium]|nr:methyltransferase domain-containing protein [Flavobacteriales bacterium]